MVRPPDTALLATIAPGPAKVDISLVARSARPGRGTLGMVYYFTSDVVDPPGFIYVGKDKFESEGYWRAEGDWLPD